MKKISLLPLLLLIFTLLALPSSAATLGSADNFTLGTEINDDGYFAGGTVNINENVAGDLYVAGGNITINGNVTQDLVVAGGTVNLLGNVGDDLRVFGGQVLINGDINDDVILGGGQVEITNSSRIGGSLIGGSGVVNLNGNVSGDVRGGMGILSISGVVGGQVKVDIQDKIDITANGRVNGDVIYQAPKEMTIAADRVGGKIQYTKLTTRGAAKELGAAYLFYSIWSFLAALVVLLLFVLLKPNFLLAVSDKVKATTWKSLGIGLLVLIITPIVAIILMTTVIGIPLALILLVTYGVLLYLAKIFIAVWLASYVFNFVTKKNAAISKVKLFFASALALLIVYIVGMIPIVGWLINAVLFLIALGGFLLTELDCWRFMRSKKMY